MQTKKIMCVFLCLTILVGMLAGCVEETPPTQESSTPTTSPTDTTEPLDTTEPVESLPVEEPPVQTLTREEATALIDSLTVTDSEKEELLRAYNMGLPLDNLEQETLTAKEYMVFLDVLVKTYAPDRIEDWKELYPVFRSADTVLTRYDALAALYLAANFLGEEYISAKNALLFCGGQSSDYESDPFGAIEGLSINYETEQPNWNLFGEELRWEQFPHPVPTSGATVLNDVAYMFNFARPSKISDEFPFTADEVRGSIRPMDSCTYAEAILAVLRCKDSYISRKEAMDYLFPNMTYLDINDTEALAPYYAEMEKRKNDILTSETTIVKSDTFIRGETYTGTAYYVSNSGDDANDGLTPETAWRTHIRVSQAELKPGDAVFFKRGDIFRLTESSLYLKEDVTYSAYGTGEKPVFTLSAENSAKPEYWSLYYEGADGKKIWKYTKLLGDVGGIVLDDEYMCMRELEWPTPEGWLALDFDGNNDFTGGCYYSQNTGMVNTGKYLAVEENLTKNLTFISRFDTTNITYPTSTYEVDNAVLYLRCDEGNPGVVCDSIEIIAGTKTNGGYSIQGSPANGFVLDNIAIKHYLCAALHGSLDSCRSAVMQNCVVAWGGSRLHYIYTPEPTQDTSSIGDGVYVFCNNVTFRNNYLYRTNTGFTFETVGDPSEPMDLGTLKIVGNVFEDCDTPINLTFGEGCAPDAFDEIIIQDNYMSGTAKYRQQPIIYYEAYAIHINYQNIRFFEHCDISENVILGSERLIFATQHKDFPFDIHDNVVAQSPDGLLWLEQRMHPTAYGRVWGNLWYPFEGMVEE